MNSVHRGGQSKRESLNIVDENENFLKENKLTDCEQDQFKSTSEKW